MKINKEASKKFETLLVNVLKLPGVKVNRDDFLYKTFLKDIDNPEKMAMIIKENPIKAGIDASTLDKIAKDLISKRTNQTSSASFAAGLPGGLAMLATVPADSAQFFAVTLRLAQELAYLYGFEDLWNGNDIDDARVKNELILFLGVMFGVGGSASAVRMISSRFSDDIFKIFPGKSLLNTILVPVITSISSVIGLKLTKDTVAKSMGKVVPLLGGVISGTLTYVSMKPMGNRLNKTLQESIFYNKNDLINDIKILQKDIPQLESKSIEKLLID